MQPEKYKNKYLVQSARLQGYDYSQNGLYFVTICTKDREHFFGEVENGKMILNDVGKIADQFWKEIPKYFPFVNLDEYVVMPNHVHGNLEIINDKNSVEARLNNGYVEARFIATEGCTTDNANIPRDAIATPRDAINRVSTIWQSRFYDHIIRDEKELNRIREYIQNNPSEWERDRNNSENLWM